MSNKVALVTGASSGIGRALCLQLARKGYRVAGMARNIDKLNELDNEIKKLNLEFLPVQGDVRLESDCKKLVDITIEKWGRIDILINNAGISMRALFDEVRLDVLHELMNTNFWGTVYCTYYALPHLLKNKGSLVGVSSIAGYQALPARTGYSASKFAIQGFLNTIRIENLYTGLHVMIACPGFTASNIRNTALTADGSQQKDTPLEEGKLMSAEIVASRIIKGIEKRKRQVIMTTEGKLTVFLGKFFPALVDKLVFKDMLKEKNSPLIKKYPYGKN
ncbi:MAG: SDR family oxidoreductase [Bacteroidales bacterium]|nr:SDR family oxidoreductase [Bacteroidales bacterium]